MTSEDIIDRVCKHLLNGISFQKYKQTVLAMEKHFGEDATPLLKVTKLSEVEELIRTKEKNI